MNEFMTQDFHITTGCSKGPPIFLSNIMVYPRMDLGIFKLNKMGTKFQFVFKSLSQLNIFSISADSIGAILSRCCNILPFVDGNQLSKLLGGSKQGSQAKVCSNHQLLQLYCKGSMPLVFFTDRFSSAVVGLLLPKCEVGQTQITVVLTLKSFLKPSSSLAFPLFQRFASLVPQLSFDLNYDEVAVYSKFR